MRKSPRLPQRSGEQIEKIQRVIRLGGLGAVAIRAVRAAGTVQQTLRRGVAARGTLNPTTAAAAVMMMVGVHPLERLGRVLLKRRERLLGRLQIT